MGDRSRVRGEEDSVIDFVLEMSNGGMVEGQIAYYVIDGVRTSEA